MQIIEFKEGNKFVTKIFDFCILNNEHLGNVKKLHFVPFLHYISGLDRKVKVGLNVYYNIFSTELGIHIYNIQSM